jgi:hypothetical protein
MPPRKKDEMDLEAALLAELMSAVERDVEDEELYEVVGEAVEEVEEPTPETPVAVEAPTPAPEPTPEPVPAVEPTPAPAPAPTPQEEATAELEEMLSTLQSLPPVTILGPSAKSIAAKPAQLPTTLEKMLEIASYGIDRFKKENIQTPAAVIGPFVAVDRTRKVNMFARILVVTSRSVQTIDVIDESPASVSKALLRAALA